MVGVEAVTKSLCGRSEFVQDESGITDEKSELADMTIIITGHSDPNFYIMGSR